MRQTHVAGEKLFVDFAGDTVPVFNAVTGEARESKIFVAVLGASNYKARFSEALPEWICAHVNTFAFLGGVLKAIVCDKLKAGVTAANRYEPGVPPSPTPSSTASSTTLIASPRSEARQHVVCRAANRNGGVVWNGGVLWM
jgi:hypothetical protein